MSYSFFLLFFFKIKLRSHTGRTWECPSVASFKQERECQSVQTKQWRVVRTERCGGGEMEEKPSWSSLISPPPPSPCFSLQEAPIIHLPV